MAKVERWFGSQELAAAFREGLEYVNDSQISDIKITAQRSGWVISFEDEDEEYPIEM